MGEDDDLDFSLSVEDMEWINGGLEDLEEKEEDEGKESDEKEKAPEVTEEDKEKTKDTVESESSERVDGDSTDGKDDDEVSSPQLYKSLATVLKEQGVFSSVDESSINEVKDIQSLVEVVKKQIKAEEFSDLTEQQRIVLEDMRAGVKPDTASKFKVAMDRLEQITEETLKDDKQAIFDVIYQDFVSRGFTEEQAGKYANRSVKSPEAVSDALEAKTNLIEAIKKQYGVLKQKELEDKKAEDTRVEKQKEELGKKILETEEILTGLKISEKMRKEVLLESTKIVSADPKTGKPENALQKHQRENPVDYYHKLYYLYKATNGFKDFSHFENKKVSNATNTLERALKQSTHVNMGGNPNFADDADSNFLDIGELVVPE